MKCIILAMVVFLFLPALSAASICTAGTARSPQIQPADFVTAMGREYQAAEVKPTRQGRSAECTASANATVREELEQFVAGKSFVLVRVDGIEVSDTLYTMEFGKNLSFSASSCNTYRGRAEFSDYGYLFVGGRDFSRTPCVFGEASLIDDTLHEMVLNRANILWDGSDSLLLSAGDDPASGVTGHVLVYRLSKTVAPAGNAR